MDVLQLGRKTVESIKISGRRMKKGVRKGLDAFVQATRSHGSSRRATVNSVSELDSDGRRSTAGSITSEQSVHKSSTIGRTSLQIPPAPTPHDTSPNSRRTSYDGSTNPKASAAGSFSSIMSSFNGLYTSWRGRPSSDAYAEVVRRTLSSLSSTNSVLVLSPMPSQTSAQSHLSCREDDSPSASCNTAASILSSTAGSSYQDLDATPTHPEGFLFLDLTTSYKSLDHKFVDLGDIYNFCTNAGHDEDMPDAFAPYGGWNLTASELLLYDHWRMVLQGKDREIARLQAQMHARNNAEIEHLQAMLNCKAVQLNVLSARTSKQQEQICTLEAVNTQQAQNVQLLKELASEGTTDKLMYKTKLQDSWKREAQLVAENDALKSRVALLEALLKQQQDQQHKMIEAVEVVEVQAPVTP